MDGMLILKFLVLTTVVSGVLIFVLKKVLFDSTQGAVNRLNKETEEVQTKQKELNQKIKEANEELAKRKKEADDLVAKMTDEAEEKAKEEREKMIAKAREESEEIIAKAQRTKEDLKKVIEKDMEMKTVDFTIEILDHVLVEKAKEMLHQAMVEDFLNELEKMEMDVVTQEVDTAEVVVASDLDDKVKERLISILNKKLNRTVNIEVSQDPQIISGVILKMGSLALDGSLKNSIREQGLSLKEKIERTT